MNDPLFPVNEAKAAGFKRGQLVRCTVLPERYGYLVENEIDLPAREAFQHGRLEAGDQFEAKFAQVYGKAIMVTVTKYPVEKCGHAQIPEKWLRRFRRLTVKGTLTATINVSSCVIQNGREIHLPELAEELRKSVAEQWSLLDPKWDGKPFDIDDNYINLGFKCGAGNPVSEFDYKSSGWDSPGIPPVDGEIAAHHAVKGAAKHLEQSLMNTEEKIQWWVKMRIGVIEDLPDEG